MHMLICDDDARFAARVEQLVRACLGQREIPAEIVVCTSGEEALAVPDLELYQVALLDVDLDTMNGISLGRQLRERSPEICLIYISAYLEFAPEGYTGRTAPASSCPTTASTAWKVTCARSMSMGMYRISRSAPITAS